MIVARIWPTVTVSCWRLAANFVERRTERNLRRLDGDGCNHCLTFQRVSDYALPRSVQGKFLSTLARAFACGGIMIHNMGCTAGVNSCCRAFAKGVSTVLLFQVHVFSGRHLAEGQSNGFVQVSPIRSEACRLGMYRDQGGQFAVIRDDRQRQHGVSRL